MIGCSENTRTEVSGQRMQVSAKYIQFQTTEYCYMTTLLNNEAETLLHSAPSSGHHDLCPAWLFRRLLPLFPILNMDLKHITVNNSSSCSLVTQQTPGPSTRCSGRETKQNQQPATKECWQKRNNTKYAGKNNTKYHNCSRGFQEPSLLCS